MLKSSPGMHGLRQTVVFIWIVNTIQAVNEWLRQSDLESVMHRVKTRIYLLIMAVVSLEMTSVTTSQSIYRRRGKIRWAEHSQFQSHWSFRWNIFALPWPLRSTWCSTIKGRCLNLRINFRSTLENRGKRKSLAQRIFPRLGYRIKFCSFKHMHARVYSNVATYTQWIMYAGDLAT